MVKKTTTPLWLVLAFRFMPWVVQLLVHRVKHLSLGILSAFCLWMSTFHSAGTFNIENVFIYSCKSWLLTLRDSWHDPKRVSDMCLFRIGDFWIKLMESGLRRWGKKIYYLSPHSVKTDRQIDRRKQAGRGDRSGWTIACTSNLFYLWRSLRQLVIMRTLLI